VVAHGKQRYYTPEEYLERERDAEFKSEYDDGVIIAMAGSSPEHSAITFNMGVALAPHLRRAGCRGFSSDLRVRIDAVNKYYYPDFAAVCGPVESQTIKSMESLLNPALIVEVLSSSTEQLDRGRKWIAYQSIRTLQEYVLVHQDRPCVEAFTLIAQSGAWEYRKAEGLESAVQFQPFNCEITLAEVYADVVFKRPLSARR